MKAIKNINIILQIFHSFLVNLNYVNKISANLSKILNQRDIPEHAGILQTARFVSTVAMVPGVSLDGQPSSDEQFLARDTKPSPHVTEHVVHMLHNPQVFTII